MKTLFSCLIHLEGGDCAIHEQNLKSLVFESPYWKPDVVSHVIMPTAGFIAVNRFVFNDCSLTYSPFQMKRSRFTIVGDVFLSNKLECLDKVSSLGLCESKKMGSLGLVLSLFIHYGEACLNYLQGEFCFLIWDNEKKSAFLAVDQFGWRPLYYSMVNGSLIVSNCMYAFEEYLKLSTIDNYFLLDSLSNFLSKEEKTLYEEVKAVARAHFVNIQRSSTRKARYWRPTRKRIRYKREETYYEHARELLNRAVSVRSNTPYKLGSHLSGGLDSSSLSAVTAQIMREKNRTLFSYCAIPHPKAGKLTNFSEKITRDDRVLASELQSMYENLSLDFLYSDLTNDPVDFLREMVPFLGSPPVSMMNALYIQKINKTHAGRGGRVMLSSVGGNCTLSHNISSYFSKYKKSAKLALDYFSHYVSKRNKKDSISHFYLDNYSRRIESNRLKVRRKLINHSDFLYTRAIPYVSRFKDTPEFYSGCFDTDPMWDFNLANFAISIPGRLHKGRGFIRNMMKGEIPESIRLRRTRGEQSADWKQWFGLYHRGWLDELHSSESVSKLLDLNKIKSFISSNKDYDDPYSYNVCKSILINDIMKTLFFKFLEERQ